MQKKAVMEKRAHVEGEEKTRRHFAARRECVGTEKGSISELPNRRGDFLHPANM